MEVGTGWIGWTEDQTLNTSFAAIERALKGRLDMMHACFGGGEETPPVPTPTPPNAAAVKSALRAALEK